MGSNEANQQRGHETINNEEMHGIYPTKLNKFSTTMGKTIIYRGLGGFCFFGYMAKNSQTCDRDMNNRPLYEICTYGRLKKVYTIKWTCEQSLTGKMKSQTTVFFGDLFTHFQRIPHLK